VEGMRGQLSDWELSASRRWRRAGRRFHKNRVQTATFRLREFVVSTDLGVRKVVVWPRFL